MAIDNPFRGPDEDAPDFSTPQACIDQIQKVSDEMNATMARLVTGEIEPMDLVVEALSGVFAAPEVCEAILVGTQDVVPTPGGIDLVMAADL